MDISLFLFSIILMCFAQLVRVLRWKLFIEIYEKPQDKNLIQSLALGNFINLFLPFRIVGDFFKAIFSGKKMKNSYSLSFSTIIVDRILDVITVGMIFAIMYCVGISDKYIEKSLLFYITISIFLIIGIGITYGGKKYVKIISSKFASMFNANIELYFLKFMWSLIWNFKDIFLKINKIKMIGITGLMWILYIGSYFLFSMFLSTVGYNKNLIDVFVLFFSNDTFALNILYNTLDIQIYVLTYISISTIVFLLFSFMLKNKNINNQKVESYLNLLPNENKKERLEFLKKYFLDEDKNYIKNYLKINQDITVIRDFSAGSNATTMLCMKNDKMFYRKYAIEDREKLYDQIVWIEKNKKRGLPLPKILNKEKNDEYCFYDMSYDSNAMVLFEYVHSMPDEDGWNITQKALDSLNKCVYTQNVRPSDKETIFKYIESKVTKNIDTILQEKIIKRLLKYDEIYINGKAYKNLPYYLKFLSKEYLYEIFKNDSYSELHGDLTIENIVCTRNKNSEDGFYIIDPNTGNLHDSPNLDYGKLLQSIHGGYEFMMKNHDLSYEENRINFLFTKSHTYVYFYEKLNEYMKEEFSYEKIRSIYFHEIVHWLRLVPYKFRIDRNRVHMFYAGLLMVLNDVIEMFGDNNEKK